MLVVFHSMKGWGKKAKVVFLDKPAFKFFFFFVFLACCYKANRIHCLSQMTLLSFFSPILTSFLRLVQQLSTEHLLCAFHGDRYND